MSLPARAATRDLTRTREDILRVATRQFMLNGYHGARVDEIAAETSTTKRMIYYCFENKDGLFEACLKQAYAGMRELEQSLHLTELEPRAAVARYVEATLRYHQEHPELARLARAENLLDAAHMRAGDLDEYGHPVVEMLDAVIAHGLRDGVFRPGVTGLDLHVAISAIANFRITNGATIAALFDRQLRDPAQLEYDIASYVRLALGWLDPEPHGLDVPVVGPQAAT